MGAVTVEELQFDPVEELVERTARKVRRYEFAARLAALRISLRFDLWRILRGLEKLHCWGERLSAASAEDRENLLSAARRLMSMSKRISNTEDQYATITKSAPRWLAFLDEGNRSRFEDAACLAEDLAETLALLASPEFQDLIDRELSVLDGRA